MTDTAFCCDGSLLRQNLKPVSTSHERYTLKSNNIVIKLKSKHYTYMYNISIQSIYTQIHTYSHFQCIIVPYIQLTKIARLYSACTQSSKHRILCILRLCESEATQKSSQLCQVLNDSKLKHCYTLIIDVRSISVHQLPHVNWLLPKHNTSFYFFKIIQKS